MEDWSRLRDQILRKLVPGPTERQMLADFINKHTSNLQTYLTRRGFHVSVEVHGSVSRDTWLRGQRDIDVFLVLDSGQEREIIPDLLNNVKRYLQSGWVEAYAEHPYIKADIDGFRVEFVPCFRIELGEKLISSTDRTPLHTKYIEGNLKPDQTNEVRLLKQFMEGIGVYGAEIKIRGFSGYLCELLILEYGDFIILSKAASGWRKGKTIQFHNEQDPEKLRKRFRDPLIVIDPVDSSRNVASAVSKESFWTFVAAVRAFLEKPSEKFFFSENIRIEDYKLIKMIINHPLDILFLVILDKDEYVPDVLWGQLNKTREAIVSYLEDQGFCVSRSAFWSDEKQQHVLILELESETISSASKQYGPPVRMEENSKRFLDVHVGAENTVSGPYIEEDRWWVITRREYSSACKGLEAVLDNSERGIGVSKRISNAITRNHSVLLNDEIEPYLTEKLNIFISKFLKGRPDWIE